MTRSWTTLCIKHGADHHVPLFPNSEMTSSAICYKYIRHCKVHLNTRSTGIRKTSNCPTSYSPSRNSWNLKRFLSKDLKRTCDTRSMELGIPYFFVDSYVLNLQGTVRLFYDNPLLFLLLFHTNKKQKWDEENNVSTVPSFATLALRYTSLVPKTNGQTGSSVCLLTGGGFQKELRPRAHYSRKLENEGNMTARPST